MRRANDEAQSQAWRKLAQRGGKRTRKRKLAIVDLDGHVKTLYGVQKEGADFFKGTWCYQPLVATLAQSGECLGIRNQPGAVRASSGAPELLNSTLPRTRQHFVDVLVRGDSDFDRADVRNPCERHGAHFAFVGREFRNRPRIAESIPENRWTPFRTRAHRGRIEASKRPGLERRRKKPNRRKRLARQRNFTEKRLVKQWIAEAPGSAMTYRLVIRRQLIENYEGQRYLFDEYRYRYIVTNLPASTSTRDVVDLTYERCDQENIIQQLGAGIAAWRMPVAEFDGNSAWLEIARLAWNIGKWIAQLALPDEGVRWHKGRAVEGTREWVGPSAGSGSASARPGSTLLPRCCGSAARSASVWPAVTASPATCCGHTTCSSRSIQRMLRCLGSPPPHERGAACRFYADSPRRLVPPHSKPTLPPDVEPSLSSEDQRARKPGGAGFSRALRLFQD